MKGIRGIVAGLLLVLPAVAGPVGTGWGGSVAAVGLNRPILMEYVGQVVNGAPLPSSSAQYGNLQDVADVDPALSFTFYTEADTTSVVANGPLRVIDRVGRTTIYLAQAPGDFSAPDSFRSGTPVQISTLDQHVVVDTATGMFTVVNTNTIETASRLGSQGAPARLGRRGEGFRTILTGHLNTAGGSPSGWFGGYAVPLPE
jgi:hypothetical protein